MLERLISIRDPRETFKENPYYLLTELLFVSFILLQLRHGKKDNPLYTVKPVLSGHSKIDKTQILMTNGSLMKVESIAECSHWSILQYF